MEGGFVMVWYTWFGFATEDRWYGGAVTVEVVSVVNGVRLAKKKRIRRRELWRSDGVNQNGGEI